MLNIEDNICALKDFIIPDDHVDHRDALRHIFHDGPGRNSPMRNIKVAHISIKRKLGFIVLEMQSFKVKTKQRKIRAKWSPEPVTVIHGPTDDELVRIIEQEYAGYMNIEHRMRTLLSNNLLPERYAFPWNIWHRHIFYPNVHLHPDVRIALNSERMFLLFTNLYNAKGAIEQEIRTKGE